MRVRRDLLEQMAFAGATGAELNHVVVPLDKGNHPQQRHVARTLAQPLRLKPDAAQKKILPLHRRQFRPSSSDLFQDPACRELDWSHGVDLEGPAATLLRDG